MKTESMKQIEDLFSNFDFLNDEVQTESANNLMNSLLTVNAMQAQTFMEFVLHGLEVMTIVYRKEVDQFNKDYSKFESQSIEFLLKWIKNFKNEWKDFFLTMSDNGFEDIDNIVIWYHAFNEETYSEVIKPIHIAIELQVFDKIYALYDINESMEDLKISLNEDIANGYTVEVFSNYEEVYPVIKQIIGDMEEK